MYGFVMIFSLFSHEGFKITGYDSIVTVGEERTLSCSSDVFKVKWINKTDNTSLQATSYNHKRVDFHIPIIASHHNGAELACQAVSTNISSEKIILNVTSELLCFSNIFSVTIALYLYVIQLYFDFQFLMPGVQLVFQMRPVDTPLSNMSTLYSVLSQLFLVWRLILQ